MKHKQDILSLLPHQPPFRFVDDIIQYVPGKLLQARFHPERIPFPVDSDPEVPQTILLEGLAQTAVLLTQLETKPLSAGEIPLLGSVSTSTFKPVMKEELVDFSVRPVRIMGKQAVISGEVNAGGVLAVSAHLSVAVANEQPSSKEEDHAT